MTVPGRVGDRVSRVGLIACATCATALLLPSVGHALVTKARFGWYWYAGTIDRESNKELDPLNIVWLGKRERDGAPGSKVFVSRFVEDYWAGGGKMKERDCGNTKLGRVRDGRQRAAFRVDDPQWTGARPAKELNGYETTTSTLCTGSQYHMRFWGDGLHARVAPGHGSVDQWQLSGVHRDMRKCDVPVPNPAPCGHKVSKRWVGYRNYAVNRAMRALCTRSRWRFYHGADRLFQTKRNDGYIALVMLKVGNRDTCPRGLY